MKIIPPQSHILPFHGRPPRPPSRDGRVPGELVRQVIRDHFHYELRDTPQGTRVIANPLSRAAEEWLRLRKLSSVQVNCPDDQAGDHIRRIEAAVDVSKGVEEK